MSVCYLSLFAPQQQTLQRAKENAVERNNKMRKIYVNIQIEAYQGVSFVALHAARLQWLETHVAHSPRFLCFIEAVFNAIQIHELQVTHRCCQTNI